MVLLHVLKKPEQKLAHSKTAILKYRVLVLHAILTHVPPSSEDIAVKSILAGSR